MVKWVERTRAATKHHAASQAVSSYLSAETDPTAQRPH